jgi:hypothetical protein
MRIAEMIGASATKLHFGASDTGTPDHQEHITIRNAEVPKSEIMKARIVKDKHSVTDGGHTIKEL